MHSQMQWIVVLIITVLGVAEISEKWWRECPQTSQLLFITTNKILSPVCAMLSSHLSSTVVLIQRLQGCEWVTGWCSGQKTPDVTPAPHLAHWRTRLSWVWTKLESKPKGASAMGEWLEGCSEKGLRNWDKRNLRRSTNGLLSEWMADVRNHDFMYSVSPWKAELNPFHTTLHKWRCYFVMLTFLCLRKSFISKAIPSFYQVSLSPLPSMNVNARSRNATGQRYYLFLC